MAERVMNILLVEDDEVDIMNVKRAFKKLILLIHYMLPLMV